MFISQTTDFHFANYRFPFRKLQIFISQTTDSHFANYRFSFRKLQILISQTTDSHFANYRFPFRKVQISISQTTDFHFVSSHFVSQTTVSRINSTHSSCDDPAGDDPVVVLTLWIGSTSILLTPSPIFNEVFCFFTESGNKILNCLSAMDAREEEDAATFAFTTNLSNLWSKINQSEPNWNDLLGCCWLTEYIHFLR